MNYETHALSEQWDFVLNMFMKHMNFLISWLGILMNLKLVVLIYTSHPLASLIVCLLCVNCHCCDHDNNSYPYYISADGFARLTSMIETINKQPVEFTTKI